MEPKYDFLVVGAGLTGSILAYEAKKAGKKVLVLDKRSHVAGNIYTEKVNNINVHKYGAHIFHTSNKDVWNYVVNLVPFNRFTNSPVANFNGEMYSLPFNMYTFNKMWGVQTPKEALGILELQRSEIKTEPKNLEEQAIKLVGRDIYEKLIKGYTEKQWGRQCVSLPPFIIKRLPVRLTYDNNYFNSDFQGIPVNGYTELISKMLDNIEVRLNTNYLLDRDYFNSIAKTIIYTGPIDEFYNYIFGPLEYRSIHFEIESYENSNYQGNAVVNYTDASTPWTRIIEHKWFNFGLDLNGNTINNTIISKEYSSEWKCGDEPYYPVNDERNNLLFLKYKELSKRNENLIFCGRLGEYKYYDMDVTIEKALLISKQILKR